MMADPQKVGDRRRRARDTRTREQMDLEAVLSSESGRRFYYRVVFLLCDIEGDTFDGKVRDGFCVAMHQARDNGKRWIGRKLRDEAQATCPDLWVAMIEEGIARERQRLIERQLQEQEPTS